MTMNRRGALKFLAGAATCPLCASAASAAEGAHWSYEGHAGPEHWGDLDATSRVCSAGSQQSPIDIGDSVRATLPKLDIRWSRNAADTIVNNGHTIQVNAAAGSTLGLGRDSYKLLQFHFHRPSEHTVGGKPFPMEVHFVHQNAAGPGLAVVGVLMASGKANAAFAKVIATMPAQEGPAVKAAAGIDPNAFLPPGRNYFRYTGSLTTPPCTETVEWLLMTDPIAVADADINKFAALYTMNARPVQKINRRYVLRSG